MLKWSFIFSFPVVTCLDLRRPANSDIILYNGGTSNLRPPGSVATYTCVTGYRIVGTASTTITRRCHTNGGWGGTTPACQREIVTQLLRLMSFSFAQ